MGYGIVELVDVHYGMYNALFGAALSSTKIPHSAIGPTPVSGSPARRLRPE